MIQEVQALEITPDSFVIMVSVSPFKNGMMKSQVFPVQNVKDFAHAFSILVDATGSAAAMMVKDNPFGITDHEEMAQFIAQSITKVIMTAQPVEEDNHGN